jgi:hypothetical protein
MAKRQKNRQYNGQKKKAKRINNDLQHTTQKTKDQATRIQINTQVLRKVQQFLLHIVYVIFFIYWELL